jgi:hypothetical protein
MKVKTILAQEYSKSISKNETYIKFLSQAYIAGFEQAVEYIANFPVFDGVYTIAQGAAEGTELLEMLKEEILDAKEHEI